MVDSAPNKTECIRGPTKLGIAKIKFRSSAIGELPFGIWPKKAPHVEIFDAVLAVDIVERTALTQSYGEKPMTVETACLRLALE
jgi:hypothetical protein